MAIEWDPSLSLGVREIDRQHIELFRCADNLYRALRERRGQEAVEETTEFLREYVAVHFRSEEQLMRTSGYPHLEEHAKEHEAFVVSFDAIVAEHRRSGASATLAIKVNTVIGNWLRSHIGVNDRAFATFLRQRSRAA